MPTKFKCGGKIFTDFSKALEHADFIFQSKGIILGIEEV